MNLDSKIYVAGHTGMVGSAVVRALKAAGYTNLISRTIDELDLLRQKEVEDFFDQEKPEYVFMCAAKVGGIAANNELRADFIYQNLQIQNNVIWTAFKSGVKKLLFLGSSCIYPKDAPQPIKEEYLLTGPLEPTNEPYAIAKIAGLKLCESLNRQYGANFISAMPTNMYGPNDNYDLKTSHVLPAMIRKFHLAKLYSQGYLEAIKRDIEMHSKGEPIPDNLDLWLEEHGIYKDRLVLWGSGKPRREFLHVNDCAAALVWMMREYNDPLHVNIGRGDDLSIEELAQMIARVISYRGEIEFDTEHPDGTKRKLLDISKLIQAGWKPSIDLEQGIAQTYRTYLSI